jgi:hypothetical protein
MTYFNTNRQTGDRLKQYQTQAATQDNKIANFFTLYAGEAFTAWEVQSLAFTIGKDRPPITSVRRSMTTLTKAGILTKTDILKEAGQYGRRSYAWILNEKYRETLNAMEEILGDESLEDPDKQEKLPRDHPDLQNKDMIGALVNLLDQTFESSKSPLSSSQLYINGMEPPEPADELLRCGRCGRPLSNPKSIAQGLGPVCMGRCIEEAENETN